MTLQLISLINDFMRGQLTYHEAIQQKHREVRPHPACPLLLAHLMPN